MPDLRIRMGGRPGATEGSVSAGHASATGAATAIAASIRRAAGLASATGAANRPAAKVRPAAGLATATGIGRNASTGGDPAWSIANQTMFSGITVTNYTPPGTIPHDGSTSSSSALNTYLRTTVGSGTAGNYRKVSFGAFGTLRLTGSAGIDLSGLSYMWIDFGTTTILIDTDGTSNTGAGLFIPTGHHLKISNGFFLGGNAATGTSATVWNEKKNGCLLRAGCHHIELDTVSWDTLYGFGIMANVDGGSIGQEPTDIWVHDIYMRGAEMAIAAVGVKRLLVEDSVFDDTQIMVFDCEPDITGETVEDVWFRRNTIDTYGCGQILSSYFFAANGMGSAQGYFRRIWATDNTIIKGALGPNNGGYDEIGGIGVRSDDVELEKTDFRIERNTSEDPDAQTSGGQLMSLANINGLRVVDNHNPISGAAPFVRQSGNTGGVVVSGNTQ